MCAWQPNAISSVSSAGIFHDGKSEQLPLRCAMEGEIHASVGRAGGSAEILHLILWYKLRSCGAPLAVTAMIDDEVGRQQVAQERHHYLLKRRVSDE